MPQRKKIVVGIVVYLFLVFGWFVFLLGVPMHRRNLDQAYMAWLKTPTPQTKSLLETESRKDLFLRPESAAEAAASFWLVGASIYYMSRILPEVVHRQTGTRITSK